MKTPSIFSLGLSVCKFTALALLCSSAYQVQAALPADIQAGAALQQEPVSDQVKQLNRLYEDYWQASLKLNPLQATLQGDMRYNDQLTNYLSPEFRESSYQLTQEWLDKAKGIGSAGLEGQDYLNYQIFIHDAENALEAAQFPTWVLPVNPYSNVVTVTAILGSGTGPQPFNTVTDYDNWLKRTLGIPALFEQTIANMSEGMEKEMLFPPELVEQVLPQLDLLIKPTAEESLFWTPILKLPEDFSEDDKQRLTTEYKRMIEQKIMPYYRRLRGFIATRYLPAARADTHNGLSSLPNGDAWYAYYVRQNTTTSLTPTQVHETGLNEVERIQGEIQELMRQVRFRRSMTNFFQFMASDPQFVYTTDTQLLQRYQTLENSVNAQIPHLFAIQPKAELDIQPTLAVLAPSSPALSYTRPSEDGSRPGTLNINTSDLPLRKSWVTASLYLHEGIPGHHYQLALQHELSDLPIFRRLGGEIAFIEGWGLYVQSLGKELGAYKTPYDEYGYLQEELFRSAQMVVDTGLHSKSWTRQRAIDYFTKNTHITAEDAAPIVDRSLAIPGQTLAYKAGQLKIIELRQQAQHELGSKFNLAEFHAEIIKDGSMPMILLERKIHHWIAQQK